MRPSSPPVSQDSCEASIRKADATASVIIAKKIARTRSENRPIANDSASDSSSDDRDAGAQRRSRSAPCGCMAIATP